MHGTTSQCSHKATASAPQVKAKYNATMADLFREAFCWLPLAHCLNGKVLVVHGGLFSRDGVTLDELRQIDRFRCARAPAAPWQLHAAGSGCIAGSRMKRFNSRPALPCQDCKCGWRAQLGTLMQLLCVHAQPHSQAPLRRLCMHSIVCLCVNGATAQPTGSCAGRLTWLLWHGREPPEEGLMCELL